MTTQGFRINDPRPIAADAPYSFFLPSAQAVSAVTPGDLVKLIISAVPASDRYDAERLWIEVTESSDDTMSGVLVNDPYDIAALSNGDRLDFERAFVIAIHWQDEAMYDRFVGDDPDPEEHWLQRCFVDAEIIEGTARIGFIYREAPEHAPEDRYPDSGWRIRADVNDLTEEQYENPRAEYIALCAVLNVDDSFLRFLDAPQGARFLRETGQDAFAETPESVALTGGWSP